MVKPLVLAVARRVAAVLDNDAECPEWLTQEFAVELWALASSDYPKMVELFEGEDATRRARVGCSMHSCWGGGG